MCEECVKNIKKMLKEHALNTKNVIKMLKTAYNNKKKTQQTVNVTRSKWRRKAYFFLFFSNNIQMFEF